jgi:hypothetical protein
MSGPRDTGLPGRERRPGDGFDFTLIVLDDAGSPHLALSAEPVAPRQAVSDPLPGPAVRAEGRRE